MPNLPYLSGWPSSLQNLPWLPPLPQAWAGRSFMSLHGPLCLFSSGRGSHIVKLPVYLSVSPTSLKLLEDKGCVWFTVHIFCVPLMLGTWKYSGWASVLPFLDQNCIWDYSFLYDQWVLLRPVSPLSHSPAQQELTFPVRPQSTFCHTFLKKKKKENLSPFSGETEFSLKVFHVGPQFVELL